MFALAVFAVLCFSAVSARDTRIINGEIAAVGAYPHQCSLATRTPTEVCTSCNSGYDLSNGQCCSTSWPFWCMTGSCKTSTQMYSHFCGAALIAKNWAVTAAHCVDGTSASSIEVFVGVHDRTEKREDHKTYPTEIIMHPNYNDGSSGAYPNDIALIKLGRDVENNDDIQHIELADSSDGDFAGKTCHISGWGKTDSGDLATKLKVTDGTILANSVCSKTDDPNNGGYYWGSNINAGHICIDRIDTGACNGDSGGPLTCTGSDGTPKLAGVTSWGRSGCDTKYPSVYSRITHFKKWLDDTMAAN